MCIDVTVTTICYYNKTMNLVLMTENWGEKSLKPLSNLRTDENVLSLTKGISEKPTANIILTVND